MKSFYEQISVKETIEHEDGSATFVFDMTEEAKDAIIQSALLGAIIRGIESEEKRNEEYVRRSRFTEAAEEFLRMTTLWINNDDIDWDPHVKPSYEKAKELYDARKES